MHQWPSSWPIVKRRRPGHWPASWAFTQISRAPGSSRPLSDAPPPRSGAPGADRKRRLVADQQPEHAVGDVLHGHRQRATVPHVLGHALQHPLDPLLDRLPHALKCRRAGPGGPSIRPAVGLRAVVPTSVQRQVLKLGQCSGAVARIPQQDGSEPAGERHVSRAQHVAIERDEVVLWSHVRNVVGEGGGLTRQ